MPPASLKLRVLIGAGVATVVAVIGGLALGGTDGSQPDRPAPPAAPAPVASTPLAEVDTGLLTVARDAFCDDVDPVQVNRAVGLDDDAVNGVDQSGYVDGQRAALTGTVKDVAHEYGCQWAAGRARARAWIFAPPITAEQASALGDLADQEKGCRPVASAARFGRPSTALRCPTQRGPQVSYRGLFGDAWLTCTLRSPGDADDADALAERADRWCAAVALAASSEVTAR